ncbi:TetR family transcriptional regulator [Nocardia sp. NPDC049737]|uniref:TetR/AcrR family transcriptional regulator n=1 Tax=Nocardia sp. NPDC049737 TaxID=3154358 RepID=UPI003418F6CB
MARRAAETREHFFRAATELFLTRGYAETSLKDICTRAGHGYNAFVAHYNSKSELGNEVAEMLANRGVQRIQQAAPRDIDHLITMLVKWATTLVTRPAWAMLELALVAIDDRSRAETTARIGLLRDTLTELVVSTADSSRESASVDNAMSFLVTTVIGMAIQYANGLEITGKTIDRHVRLILQAGGLERCAQE